MMDWTDRHCRVWHRQFSRHALLYTEMVTAAALVHGRAEALLAFSDEEHPVALQVGGSDPDLVGRAVRVAEPYSYDEINLNVGCPSDRVKSGAFGAVLMREPGRVARIVEAMRASSSRPVTVKCRIGVDEQVSEVVLPAFIQTVIAAGAEKVIVHARKAWLKGLSPKENRDIPPLDYELVRDMKRQFPGAALVLNGGLSSLDMAEAELARGLDGVMIGRSAYHDPERILGAADRRIFGQVSADIRSETAVRRMLGYIEAERSKGTPLHQITRHMLGAFGGQPGARRWRRVLSEGASGPGAGPELVERAMAAVTGLAA
ncbi:MAG: tRNA dihydrouridine(20/20a) synthase DusA, partial [Pseudomonadota bacterium]